MKDTNPKKPAKKAAKMPVKKAAKKAAKEPTVKKPVAIKGKTAVKKAVSAKAVSAAKKKKAVVEMPLLFEEFAPVEVTTIAGSAASDEVADKADATANAPVSTTNGAVVAAGKSPVKARKALVKASRAAAKAETHSASAAATKGIEKADAADTAVVHLVADRVGADDDEPDGDVEDEAEEPEFPAPDPALQQRLQKILAQAGIASRRKAEEMITGGHVVVNGQVVTELGSKADPMHDHIRVDGKLLHGPERLRYFVLNKPKGFVTTVSDPEGRPTVMQFFERTGERLYPVGRLDYLSEGLLLVTNDGQLANKLTRAASGVEKTYLVKVAGEPSEEMLDQLRAGVMIERGRPDPTRPHTHANKVRTAPAYVQKVREGDNPWFEVVLIEGRNRELRKMFEEIGHHVEKIRRVGYGPLVLDVEPGKLRELEAAEVEALRKTADGKLKPKRRKLTGLIPKEPVRAKRPAAPYLAQGTSTPVRSATFRPGSTDSAHTDSSAGRFVSRRPASSDRGGPARSGAGARPQRFDAKPAGRPAGRFESGSEQRGSVNSSRSESGSGFGRSGPPRSGSNRTDFSRARPSGPGRTGELRSSSAPISADRTDSTRSNSDRPSYTGGSESRPARFSKPAEEGYRPAKFAFSKPASEKHGAAPTWKNKTGAKPAWKKPSSEGRSERPARSFGSGERSSGTRTAPGGKPGFSKPPYSKPAYNKPEGDRPFSKPAYAASDSPRPAFAKPPYSKPAFNKPAGDRPFAVRSRDGKDEKSSGRNFSPRPKPGFDRKPKTYQPDFDDEPMRPRVKLHIEEIKESAPSRAVRTATRAAARPSSAPQQQLRDASSRPARSGGGWKPKPNFSGSGRPSAGGHSRPSSGSKPGGGKGRTFKKSGPSGPRKRS